MRILLVSQYYYPERNSVSEIAEHLVKLGHKVTVLTGKPNYGFGFVLPEYKKVKYEEINGVKIHRVNLVPRKNTSIGTARNYLSFHRNAKRFIRHFKEKFDIVLSVSLSPVISIAPACLYAKKNNVPHILFCEDLWPESVVATKAFKKNSLAYKLIYKWSKSLYEKCDEIIITSPSFKEYFNDVLQIKTKQFPYINQPVLENFEEKELAVEYSNKVNFVYGGNIGKLQLCDKMIEAMKLLENEDVCLHLIGNGSECENIKNLIEQSKTKNVKYHGVVSPEEISNFYKNADALIVPLANEGYVGKTIPNKAIQYLKYGKPIVGIISNDAKELLEKANGSIFADENPESIASAFKKICELSEKEKNDMGNNNKLFFESNLIVDILVKKIETELKKYIK